MPLLVILGLMFPEQLLPQKHTEAVETLPQTLPANRIILSASTSSTAFSSEQI